MDVTANLVTATQLTAWMQAAGYGATANQDQWCYAMNAILGTPCPAYDVGNPPSVQTDAQTFLDALRGWQLDQNAIAQQPGGATINGNGTAPSSTTAGIAPVPIVAPSTAPASGMGLLGPTNCAFCQWLAQNPLVLVLVAVGIYFAFFWKKK